MREKLGIIEKKFILYNDKHAPAATTDFEISDDNCQHPDNQRSVDSGYCLI